ncbi:flavodoxin family protein [Thermodesulfobacteriota bacterium]
MKKILGLSGSPRRPGNCEIMIKEISRNIDVPHQLDLLRLNDFNIMPCRGCYKCLFDAQQCVIDDDFGTIIDIISGADALIVAVPTYFLGANACLKKILDRGLALYAHLDELWGKPAVGVGIAGIEGKEGYTLLNIESFLNMMFTEARQSRICYGALPGEVMMNPDNKTAAREMAQALFSSEADQPKTDSIFVCPLCGGSTFRFLTENRVRCMLCSNSGTFETEHDTFKFHIVKDEHQFFLSKREVLKHKAWLLQMKERYLKQRDHLKKVCRPYLKEGRWIKKVKSEA